MNSPGKLIVPVLLLVLAAAVFFDVGRFFEYRRFSEGVSLYRRGDYRAAAEQFSAVSGSAALYNRGNCLVRIAEQTVAAPEVVRQSYAAAVDAYRAGLALLPDDGDMKHNLKVALVAMEKTGGTRGAPLRPHKRVDGESGLNGATTNSSELTQTDKAGTGTAVKDEDQGVGRSRKRAMTRAQAERLLAEKRGEPLLPSAVQSKSAVRRSAPPVKDW